MQLSYGFVTRKERKRRPSSRRFSISAPWVPPILPLYTLSYAGLGRAQVLAGDMAKARAAYQDFFALWKDADSDIPILKEAKTEYAKLH